MRYAAALLLTLLAVPSLAFACGVPVGGGPAGATVCNLKDKPKDTSGIQAVRFTVGYNLSGTSISFGGLDYSVPIARRNIVVGTELKLRDDLSLTLSVGATLEGFILKPNATMGTGLLAGATVSWVALVPRGYRPFILLSGTLSTSTAPTKQASGAEASWTALDIRASVAIGKTFFDTLTPYLVGRVFGGPVFWSVDNASVWGGDLYHYQVGIGGMVSTGRFMPELPIDAYVEWIPFGEKALTVGVGVSI